MGAAAGRQAQFDAAILATCRATSRPTASPPIIEIDRDTAGRFGITPATIDNALYDAFGQRIVSTIFTQSNQYRVILEADPKLQASLDSLSSIYLPTSTSSSRPGQVPLSAIAHGARGHRAAADRPPRPVPVDHDLVQPRARRLARRRGRRHQAGAPGDRPAAQRHHPVPGRGAGLPDLAVQRAAADPRRDRHRLYRAGRALRELHPSRSPSSRPCRRPASARCWR